MKRYYKKNKKLSQKPREDIGIHTKKVDMQNILRISEKNKKKKTNKIYKFCYIYIFLYLCYINYILL